MHVPNPLGGLPLILRDVNTTNPRRGELLFDYTNADLYYVNKETGKKTRLADSIYQKIIASKLENSRIEVAHSDSPESAEDPTIPEVADRRMNTWYMNITKREVRADEASESSN